MKIFEFSLDNKSYQVTKHILTVNVSMKEMAYSYSFSTNSFFNYIITIEVVLITIEVAPGFSVQILIKI